MAYLLSLHQKIYVGGIVLCYDPYLFSVVLLSLHNFVLCTLNECELTGLNLPYPAWLCSNFQGVGNTQFPCTRFRDLIVIS